jgi:hypothetical protein
LTGKREGLGVETDLRPQFARRADHHGAGGIAAVNRNPAITRARLRGSKRHGDAAF